VNKADSENDVFILDNRSAKYSILIRYDKRNIQSSYDMTCYDLHYE